jgi:hypothetical protein
MYVRLSFEKNRIHLLLQYFFANFSFAFIKLQIIKPFDRDTVKTVYEFYLCC